MDKNRQMFATVTAWGVCILFAGISSLPALLCAVSASIFAGLFGYLIADVRA